MSVAFLIFGWIVIVFCLTVCAQLLERICMLLERRLPKEPERLSQRKEAWKQEGWKKT